MRHSQTSRELIDRLEKRYQKKQRSQKSEKASRTLRQILTGARGKKRDEFDDISPELQGFGGYEYIAR